MKNFKTIDLTKKTGRRTFKKSQIKDMEFFETYLKYIGVRYLKEERDYDNRVVFRWTTVKGA